MQHKKITGIILNLRPHGDFDRIITVFSSEWGKVAVIAKGVRRIKSNRSFHLDLFNMVSMETELSRGGGNGIGIHYLREITTLRPFQTMKKNAECFAGACLIAGFLSRILPECAPQKNLYCLTQRTFEALDYDGRTRTLLLVYFLKALRLLGHLPHTLKKRELRGTLEKTLIALDPQFTLTARRTLGIFSKLESTRSS